MSKAISVNQKKRSRGRPPTGRDPAVAVRLPARVIKALDRWGKDQAEPADTRSEAIRRLIELALKAKLK